MEVLYMFLYVKKDDSVDIYNMSEKVNEIKSFKKSILRNYSSKDLFYSFRTDCESQLKDFMNCDVIDSSFFNYYVNTDIFKMDSFDSGIQKEILDKYIEGEYDSLPITMVDDFIRNNNNFGIHYFLKPQDAVEISDYSLNSELVKNIKEDISSLRFFLQGSYNGLVLDNIYNYVSRLQEQRGFMGVWQVDYMLDLPMELYLLHMLRYGNYDKVASSDITRQLQLFDIAYVGEIKLDILEYFCNVGLIDRSVMDKMCYGDDILRRVRKK